MFPNATTEDINQVMEAAQTAFLSFRTKSGKEKATFLRAIADEIEALGAELIQTAMQEAHLPEARLVGERGRTCFQLRSFADLVEEGSWIDATIDTALPDRLPLPKPDIRKISIPLGPVVVFGASNFPFAYSTAGVDPASAWAAGCSVVVKAHPGHPETSELVASAIRKAVARTGMPEGVFGHVHSTGFEAGQALVMHPLTKAVGFTGSFAGGKALFDMANQRPEPIPVFAEMGSTNPVFLMPEALQHNAQGIAKQYAGSITLGMGQFCTKPGLIFGIEGADLDAFVEALAEAIQGIAPQPMLHGGIAKAFRTKRQQVLEGAHLAAENAQTQTELEGIPSIATVSGAEFLANKTLHQEVFGPFSLVVKCSNMDELRTIITHLEGQLTATLMATEADLRAYADVMQSVSLLCGRLVLNGVPTGVEVCPAMQHGGPFPSSTDGRFGSVGAHAIRRFVRPLSYQGFADEFLPDELKNTNPLNIWRLVNSVWTKDVI
ncbi:MAG: aldehyde dehydrogenase (NADP(+)) [Spirosomataceae bacterium]